MSTNKILFEANPDTNYVFHMLSVAKCGYDNEYGEKYRSRYDDADLQIIKEQETNLTVCGGKHCGFWYGPMVCAAASHEVPAKEYYASTIDWLNAGNVQLPEEEHKAVIDVCNVMIKYYDDYISNIWPAEKARIEQYIELLEKEFYVDFAEKAEQIVGVTLPEEGFTATLVSSIKGGAEAIDISPTQDVFGIERDIKSEAGFISHEYIIYLLKIALKEEDTFSSFDTWELTEGLAEYYLKKIASDAVSFQSCQKQAENYRKLESTCGTDAVALYRAALKARD